MRVVAVIPARLASTRLEAKLLKDLAGKSIFQRTYEQASQAKLVNQVIIATDSDEIYKVAKKFGAQVEMTSKDHQSGSDRIAELAKKNADWDIIVNVQGDEPFINPTDIDKAIEPFINDPLLEMTSLYHLITDPDEINNANNVKVVTDLNGLALYFSRANIPHIRDRHSERSDGSGSTKPYSSSEKLSPRNNARSQAKTDPLDPSGSAFFGMTFKKHIGLYAYRRDTLLRLSSLPQSELEKIEKLEQLRALENGIKIKMLEVSSAPIGIDTEEDYQKALNLVKGKQVKR